MTERWDDLTNHLDSGWLYSPIDLPYTLVTPRT